MISINSVTVSYGGFTLLSDINFNISEQDKIGLVGKNGAGKSTMLKLICGLQNPTTGKIAVPGSVKIGYLPQIMEHHKGKSVIDETMTAFQEMFDLEAELERVTAELGERTDYESESYSKLIVHLNELNDRLAILRNDSPQVQAEKTLMGLGFKYEELGRPTETFSQGWNMRIELAKILLGKPDVMLLDIVMPEMDGIQALKKIKEVDAGANVIMCSAMGQQAMVIESIQAGAKDFIVKPFQAERVIEAVKKVVG